MLHPQFGRRGYFRTYEGPVQLLDYFKADWLTKNLKFDHGKLMGHIYLMGDGQTLIGEPDVYQYGWVTYIDWGKDVGLTGFPRYDFEQYDWLAFTDTPGFVWLIPTGLRGLENGNLGTWGGRLTIDGEVQTRRGDYKEYNPYTGRMDSSYSSVRFMEDMLQDWAARAEWTVNTYENANHAPVVSAKALDLYAEPGQTVDLEGIVSDPDGTEFNDIPKDSEYYLASVRVSARRFISADADGSFRPNDVMTRAEFYTLLSAAYFEKGWV